MKISDLAELKITINQLKNKARRERAKARKQEHAKRMQEHKEQSAKQECIHTQHERIFEICKQTRNAKKFHNNVSSQHAGTCKPSLITKRFGYTTIVVKSINY